MIDKYKEISWASHALIALLAILSLVMVCVPLASAETELVITGTVAPTFSIVVEPTSFAFPMSVGENEVQNTWVNSTGNSPFKVSIRDTGTIAGFSQAGLKYLDYSGTPQSMMTNPLEAKLGAHVFVPISKVDQDIYTGIPGTFSDRITYHQTVLVTDKVATGGTGGSYWTRVTITGQAI